MLSFSLRNAVLKKNLFTCVYRVIVSHCVIFSVEFFKGIILERSAVIGMWSQTVRGSCRESFLPASMVREHHPLSVCVPQVKIITALWGYKPEL